MIISEVGVDISSKDELRKLSAIHSATGHNYLAAWKDKEQNFLFVNDWYANEAGYRSYENFLESTISDFDLKCPAAELGNFFKKEDADLCLTSKPARYLTYGQYSSGHRILCGTKTPIFDQAKKNIIAIALNYIDMTQTQAGTSLLKWYMNVSKVHQNFKGKFQISLRLDQNSSLHDNLTKREQECLFYLIHGHTARETASELIISARTVEMHVDNLKIKFGCAKKSELIAKAISLGYLDLLPRTILERQSTY